MSPDEVEQEPNALADAAFSMPEAFALSQALPKLMPISTALCALANEAPQAASVKKREQRPANLTRSPVTM
jgi:hypothetical protein